MVDLTITQLPDGSATQTNAAEIAFEEAGVTSKTTVVPNAPRQFNILNQAQLEAEFGSNLEIPDGEFVALNVMESFTLTTGFKLGLDSRIRIRTAVNGVNITFTGAGALFTNVVSTDGTGTIDVADVNFFATSPTASLFDLFTIGFTVFNSTTIFNFNSLGTINASGPFGSMVFDGVFFLNYNTGLVVENMTDVNINNVTFVNQVPITPETTGLTLLSGVISVSINNLNAPTLGAGDAMLFIDPNATIANSYNITFSEPSAAGDFYQQGTDITVNAAVIGSSGGGFTNFTTAVSHGLEVGQAIVNTGFTDPAYNGTFIVVSVDTPQTGTVYEVEALFTLTGSGTMSEQSLEGDSIFVNAISNPGRKDSLAAAESDSTTDILVDVVTQDVFVPIEKAVPVSGDFDSDPATERFTIDLSTGLITYIGVEPLTGIISFQCRLIKVSGGDPDITVSLFKNSVQIAKTDITVTAPVDPGGIAIYTGGLFDIATNDTFQLFLSNTTNDNDITVSDLTLTIREA